MGDTFSVISEKSTGLSGGAKAGIAIGVLLLIGLCGGAVAVWFHRKKKGVNLFDHQQFDNPIYLSPRNGDNSAEKT